MRRDGRPVFLNLLQIRLPLPGVASILHRVSGVLLFLAIGPALWLLDLSRSAEGWQAARALLGEPWLQPLLLLLFWAFWHHLLNGLRQLLMDLGFGFGREVSRTASGLVLAAAPPLAVLCLWGLA